MTEPSSQQLCAAAAMSVLSMVATPLGCRLPVDISSVGWGSFGLLPKRTLCWRLGGVDLCDEG